MNHFWKISLICNTLLMCVFGVASSVAQWRLENAMDYDLFEGKPLPGISRLALNIWWLYLAIPVLWIIASFFLASSNWKRSKPPRDMIQLHTSLTLFTGITMLACFALAGILPFIPMIVMMSQ